MCLYPRLIHNRKYMVNKKNGGEIPPVTDKRVLYIPVGCGKCVECLRQKSREWQVRLFEDIKQHKNGKFVTLTFSEESLAELYSEVEGVGYKTDNAVATLAVRRFLERWRKKYKKSVRHWLITELGQNESERLHLHGIIYTDNAEEIEKIWKYGIVWVGKYVNERTINYITKYLTKIDTKHKSYVPKILASKGIGRNYIDSPNKERNKFRGEETREFYLTPTGHKIALPIYYRNNIYSEDEREKLWIQKMDKGDIYVMGEKININDIENLQEYQELLEYYRKKNKRMGYGDDKKTYDEDLYKLRLSQQKQRDKRYNKK